MFNRLVYNYTVQAGDSAADLDYDSTTSLYWYNGSQHFDVATEVAPDIDCRLQAPGTSGSLSFARAVAVDGIAPTALSASSPNSTGAYRQDSVIAIEVEFSEAVYVRGAPSLALGTGGSAAYDSGNRSATLTFLYTVRQADGAGILDYAGTDALVVAGAADSIRDAAGNNANLTLPAPGHQDSLAPQALRTDVTGPSVVSVHSPTYNGSYGLGAAIWIDVEFDERVYVVGGAGPTLALNVPATAAYHSGNGTDTLRLLYTVEESHNVASLEYAGASALAAAGGATMRDAAGNDADLMLEEPGDAGSLSYSSSIAINTDDPACPSADDRCVYHVTRSLGVGDIITHMVRIDPDTGYVYTASRPFAGAMDLNYSYVRIYSSADEGHELVREIRFNGTNSRVPEIEINTETDELHVINMWGVGDTEHGWGGLDEFDDGTQTGWDGTLADTLRVCNDGRAPPACFDTRGKANLTTISLDTHTVTATVQLEHDETDSDGRGSTAVQRYTYVGNEYDLALDTARDIAYVGGRNAPILAVNTSDTTLMRALVNHSAALGGGGPGSAWNGYLEGASATAMAVDEATGTVYAAVRTGPVDDLSVHTWGVATLSFLDGDGRLAPHYTRTGMVETQSNPPDPALAGCEADGYHNADIDYECGRHVRSYSVQLDAADSKLFVLFANHTVWAYGLGGSGELSAAAAPPEEVHVRTQAEAGRIGDRPVFDIVLDGERRLLYASLYDYTDPRVVSINADNHTRVGVASGTSQLGGMGLDRQTGALYVLPEWAPHAYVIEAELRPSLQAMIDDAADYSTVRVPAGMYDDTVLDIARPLTLVSDPPGAATFTGYSRIEVESDDVVVRGLAFEDTDCLPGFGGSLVEIRAHHGEARENVTIEDNTFRNTCHAAIQKEGTGGLLDVSIRNNTFEGIGLRLPDGWTEPVDTGGENEFQIMHAAIGLAHHPGQGTVGGSITDNRIVGTSAAGIRVFKADGLVISGNYIEDTPASGIGLAHSPRNVLVANNTIVDANNEPDLDYLAGVDGSGDAEYYKTIHRRLYYLAMNVLDAPYRTPAPDAAISVWSNGMNITATGNTIRESDGAFAVCAGVCAFESDGVVRAGNRNIPNDKDIENAGYSFTGNTVHWHDGPDNNGVLVRSGATNGVLDATGNYFAGLGAMPDRSVIADGMVELGEMLLPSVASVSTAIKGGAYGPGTPVYIDIEFTEAVHVQGGPPALALATMPPRDAVYHTGSGSATLTFLYTVQDGDSADGLNYRDATALALNGGTIRDATGRDVGLGLPSTDSALSLGGSVSIVPASSTAVRVTGVSSTNETGTYTGGSVIEIEVAFGAAVDVVAGDGGTATPALGLDLDPPRYATYAGGSGSATLEFLYTVQPGDGSEALDYADRAALVPNGSAIRAVSDGGRAVLTLPEKGPTSQLAASEIRVSGAHAVAEEQPLRFTDRSATAAAIAVDPHGRVLAPTVDGRVLAYSPDGTEELVASPGGRLAHIASDLSGRIIVANSTTVSVLHRNGTLAFQISGLTDVFGVASDPSGRIIVGEDGLEESQYRGRIQAYNPDGTHNDTLRTDYSRLNFVDYSGVASDPSGRILASDSSRRQIEVFDPDGTPAHTIGADRFASGDRNAIPNELSYDPSGRRLLVEIGGVAVHALRPDGSSVEFRILPYQTSFISDIASDPSGRILVAGRQGYIDIFRLDVPLAPAVEGVSARAGSHDGSLAAGESVTIDVMFDSDVSVDTTGGSPVLLLEAGALGRHATYAGSTGRNVSFTYTVEPGDESPDLGYVWAGALDPRGASITDGESGLLTASTALPPPGGPGSLSGNEAIDVDTAAPAAVSASSPNATGAYMANERIAVNVAFNEPVVVAGSPLLRLGLDGNGATGQARYNSGSGSATLTFVYTVGAGDTAARLDYAGTDALNLNDGSITDMAGNSANTTLPDPGDDGRIGLSLPIEIDTTAPRIVSASSSNQSAITYGIHDRIAINVTFNEPVAVRGTPMLALETGDMDQQARYVAGSNSTMLTFLYTVQEGANSADLDYNGTGALTLNGGSIKDAAGNDADRTLPELGTLASLAGSSAIEVDTTDTHVLNVTSDTADGAYMEGAVINVTVEFNERVDVTGTPQLAMETGETDRQANYTAGSGSAMLTFLYTVRDGDNSDDLDYANDTALALNGGTILDGMNNAATLTLPRPGLPGSLANSSNIVVDTIDPRAVSVSSPNATGAYMSGERIAVNVTFDGAVVVEGAPGLEIGLDGANGQAGYDSGSGSATLTFVYAVQDGDNAARLDYNGTNAIELGSGDSIADYAGNNANLTLPAPGGPGSLADSRNLAVDTLKPTVSAVLPLNMTDMMYTVNARIAVNVTFTEAVIVAGTPVLAMETGDTDRQADYTAGSGSNMLTFVYVVRAGDTSADLDYANRTALTLGDDATIRDAAGNNANRTLPEPGDDGLLPGDDRIRIDTMGATVDRVTSDTADGAYMEGAVIDIRVEFSEAVVVTGTPVLAMETGDADQRALYDRGTSSDTLTFLYTVQDGDNSVDLDYANDTALALNGGTIKDTSNNDAMLMLPSLGSADSLASSKAIVVDTIDPRAGPVSSLNETGAYMSGERIAVNVTFTEPVFVAGRPLLELGLQGATGQALYDSGNGSAMLTFVYTVLDGHNAANLDYTGTNALTLDGGSIKDAAGNNATLTTLPEPNSDGLIGTLMPIAIDTTAPGIQSVSPLNATGYYMAGARIAVNITFGEPVFVKGTPQLAMETGDTDRQADYTAGSGSAMLTFVYAVRQGDGTANLDYAGTDALALGDGNAGAITDAAGNDADLTTLPNPGDDGLIGTSMPIVIDTVDPMVDSVSPLNGTGTYGTGKRIAINVTFDETVVVTGVPRLALETGDTDQQALYVAGSNTSALTFVYQVLPNDNAADLDYTGTDALTLAGGTASIKDAAGNSANRTLPEPGNDGLLAGANNTIAIDGEGAGVLRVTSDTDDGAYMANASIDIKVVFSENVTVGGTGTPTLALDTGGAGQQARYDSGSNSTTLTFLYTVQPGDNSADLDYASRDALALNGSTIRDSLGNNATLTLPDPVNTDRSLAGLKDIVVDTIDPRALSASPLNATGAYMAGERIAVNVTFSEPVFVAGRPLLGLGLDGDGAAGQALYDSGNGSAMLTFVYAVQDGDSAANLDYAGTDALALGDGDGGAIMDKAGNNATLTLPDPGDDGLIGTLMPIVIDTVDPMVDSVSPLNGTGTYGTGKRIAINVSFDETVVVTGVPRLAMETGDTDRQALYVAGGNSSALTFVYQVLPGDVAADLDYNGTNALTLAGGTASIKDAAGNNANRTLPEPGNDGLIAGPGSPIAIDGTEAGVLRVTSGTPDGAYMAGAAIDVRVVFSENVTVGGTGTPTLALDTGGAGQQALYGSGNNSETLTFLYTVQPGDNSADLDYNGTGALVTNNSTIRDGNGTDAVLTLPLPGGARSLAGSKAIVVDTIDPRPESASSPNAARTYGIGERIAVSVGFTEAVFVAGTPQLALETGDTDRQADYAAGSGTDRLTFLYTVQEGDSSADLDYANASALTLNGGAITDAAGNNATLTLPEPGSDGLLAAGAGPIRIDTGGEPPPTVRGNATVLSAVFTARNAATITYSDSLDRPEGYEGPVYGNVSIVGGYNASIAPENVTGLGTATHRISFGGAGVDAGQAGTISLASELVGTSSTGAVLRFAEPAIPVERGETVRVVEQRDAPAPGAPAVAIERDGFTRAVNATGAGNGARVAINVTGLAPLAPGAAPPAANATTTTAELPAEPIRLIAVFAEVTLPANATASSVPAGGLIVLYASEDVPPAVDIAAALGIADAGSLRVRQVVEIGDNATHIAFDAPVRILLVGQAGGAGAFYINSTDGSVVPIDMRCNSDSTEAAAEQLGGAGECWIDVPGGAGASGGKVIYTYHLTRFGTAEADAAPPAADTPEPASVSVLQRPGGAPLRAPASYVEGQTITIAVDFSAPVSVDTTGGTPRILLDTGSAGAAAPYASGGGTDRLEFAYAVRGGDITGRLSYAGTDALELGGGAITAAAAGSGPGVDASLALPPPGDTGSLSAPASPAVRIDPIGRPVLAVGILDEGGNASAAGHITRAAYMAAAEFNERQGRTDGALLINATSYDAGGGASGTAAGSAAADALRSAHSSGSGPSVYVGPSTDRGLHAAMPYAAANNIVLVSAGSTAPSLAVADDRTFRLLPNDRLEAEALARLAYSGGDELVHAVLDNATYGPTYGSGSNGGLADADIPPPQGAFAHAFGAALASAAISPLSGTVTLAGGGADAGAPYDASAAAAALDASVQSAASGNRPASVVYLGSPEGLAALAEASVQYPALSSASWFASGLSAGSGLLAGNGSAAGFAASSGLSAARWSPPSSAAGQAIDSMLPGLGPGERNSAYAAYDAVIVAGEAAVAAAADLGTGSGDVPGTAAIADALPAAAAAYEGALGDIALDYAGDLWVPAVYDLWTVAAQGGAGTAAEWSRQQGELDGERSCSITLTRSRIDYGPIDSGQTSRPHLQTIVNTGQLPFAQVDLTTTPWHVDSPGNCEPGVEPSLPVGLSEIRTVQGGAFSDLTGSGTMLAQGLEAGSRAPLWYRLSLAGYADLPQAEITQCATYVVRCS